MDQSPPRFERNANAAELLHIEQARRKLRSLAIWASVQGIYLPAVIALLFTGGMFAGLPGSWPVKVLLSLGQAAALVAGFTLPILLSSTGRVALAYRRLQRDAQRAYPVAEARGEVTWGRRDRAIVAMVDGERLLSPFFTVFSKDPERWHHFDSLTPGVYSFSLLPESRLVLRAQPISMRAPGEALSLAELALRAAFRNGGADSAANRAGRSSAAQRCRLVVSRWWALFIAPLLVALSYGAIRETCTAPSSGALVGSVVGLGVTVFSVVLVCRVLWDALEGRVDSAFGTVVLSFGNTHATGWIGARKFTLRNAKAGVLQQGHCYRVYWFKRSRVIAGVDPVTESVKAR